MISPNPDLPLRDFDSRQAVAVVRDVGVGDIVMLSPSLRALKEKEPNRPLVFVTKPDNFEVLAGAHYLDAILPLNAFNPADFYKTYDLCRAVETVESGGKLTLDEYFAKPRPEIFADLLGVADRPRKFSLDCHEGALSLMNGYFKNLKRPLLGLAPTCRSPLRTIPPDYVEPLARMLQDYGGTVVLLGKTETWNKQLAQIRMFGLVNFIDRLSIKDMIAAVSLMDTMIVPNTGSLHIAGALGVKTLVVEGNNDPKTFVDIYPSAQALTLEPGELPCAPCGDQRRVCGLKQRQFGADCMQLLTPERIHQAFRAFYNGRNIAFVRDISMAHVGGAEITDRETIKRGRRLGYNIRIFDNETPKSRLYDLFNYDLIILSNLWLMDKSGLEIVMKAIRQVPYIKFEHDHRSLEAARKPYSEPMFRDSLFNVFVSPAHREDYREGLDTDGICVFPAMDLDLFRPTPGIRKPNTALLGVPRKANVKENVAGHKELRAFMEAHKEIRFDILKKIVPFEKMPEKYSAYEYFVHLPIVKWSCERVIFEAALCGCKVVTNDNAQGVSWGKDLSDPEGLRAWIKKHENRFWDEVAEKMNWRPHEVSRHRSDSVRRVSPNQVALG